jgi:hypothetical protein
MEAWIAEFNMHWKLAIDGYDLLLLATLVGFVAIAFSVAYV